MSAWDQIRQAVRDFKERDYQETIRRLADRISDERGGHAPKHGWRPPGVTVVDDDALPSGTPDGKHYRKLNFRTGLKVTDDDDRVDIDSISGGALCIDYLIIDCWATEVAAGRGSEGEQGEAFGCTFLIYSEPVAAAVHAKANRTTAGVGTTFLVCGWHTLTAAVEASTGASSQVHSWFGTNPGRDGFKAGAGSISLVTANAQGAGSGTDPTFIFKDLGFDTGGQSSVTCLENEGAAEVHADGCRINLNTEATSIGVDLGTDARGTNISRTQIAGSAGIGINGGTATAWLKVQGSRLAGLDIGVKLVNVTDIIIQNDTFYQCGYGIFFDSNPSGDRCLIEGNLFLLPDAASASGIRFDSGLNIHRDITITGNHFANIQTAGQEGIDFSPLNNAIVSAVLITANMFVGDETSNAVGVRGNTTAAYVTNSILSHNIFSRFNSGDEMPDWDAGTGNEAYHNMSTDSSGSPVKQALADIGSPVGHVNSASDLPTHTHGDPTEGGTVDHGVLDGLADDDHTQYALLAGRSGGQTLIGGTGASDALTLQATSNATPGQIVLDDDVIISDGYGIVIGHTAQLQINSITSEFQVIGNNVPDGGMAFAVFDSGGTDYPSIDLVTSRNATPGSHTIVANNNTIGAINWLPDDGVDYDTLAARFYAAVDDSSPAAGDIGMEFNWDVMPGGGGALRNVMNLDALGNLYLTATGSYYAQEKSAADADFAGYGQFWVKDDTPNVGYFTDDAGTDHPISLAASDTVAGRVELATAAETTTGTDATRAVTPDGLAGSNWGIRYFSIQVFAPGNEVTTGTGKAFFHIPPGLNGMNLVYVHGEVFTAGTGTGTDTSAVDVNKNGSSMLTTTLTIDEDETGSDTAATSVSINTSADDVATNDVISIDVDSVTPTTAPIGLIITLGFQLP